MRSLVSIVFLLCWSCSEASTPAPTDYAKLQSAFNKASALWESKGSKTYSMKYRVSCFCPEEYNQPVMVDVVNAEVKCAVYAKDADRSGNAKYNGTIERMMSMVEEAIKNEACEIDVDYDPVLGYPSSVYIAVSCGMSDIPSYYISDVSLGKHGHACKTHKRHGARMLLIAATVGVVLLAIIIAATVMVVRCRHRVSTESVTKTVGNAKYLNLQEETVEVDVDMKKSPVV